MVVAGDLNMGGSVATRSVSVSAGLFVFRYDSSKAGSQAPKVALSVPAGSDVELIATHAAQPVTLHAPGDAVVIRATREAPVTVQVAALSPGGSLDAHFVLEKLTQSSGVSQPVQAPQGLASYGTEVSVLAHVSRRGDVTAEVGEWICGPQIPMQIEGLQLIWPGRPDDVDLLVSCTASNRGRRVYCPPASAGQFVGTRGKAAPIVSVSLMLAGAGAKRYHLSCEALFLGSQIQAQEGSGIEFSGPTGREPLVGLKLSLTPVSAQHSAAPLGIAPLDVSLASRARGSAEPIRQPFFKPALPELPPLAATLSAASAQIPQPSARVRVFRAAKPVSHPIDTRS